MITAVVTIYLWYLIAKMERLVHKLEGEKNLLASVFCGLRLYKKKVDMFFIPLFIPYYIYQSIQESKNLNRNKEITEPLVIKETTP